MKHTKPSVGCSRFATLTALVNSHWINTMYRCVFALFFAVSVSLAAPASAQTTRNFPQNALRGELVVGSPPEATLNGQPTRLSAGARIRGQQNLMQLSGSLVGQKLLVNYVLDDAGQLRDLWILTPEEASKRPWPTTLREAQSWVFDPVAQTWSRP